MLCHFYRCTVSLAEDKLHLLGWPEINTNSVSERDLKILTGEGIHLGDLGLLLGSVLYDGTAPWWGKASASSSQAVSEVCEEHQRAGAPAPALAKRRRRIGPVKSLS